MPNLCPTATNDQIKNWVSVHKDLQDKVEKD